MSERGRQLRRGIGLESSIEFESERGRRAFAAIVEAIVNAPDVPEHEITAWVEAYGALPRTGRDIRNLRPRQTPLTSKQLRVVELLSMGLLEKEIAAALGISRETVKNHIARARVRLGAKNAPHLIAIAFRHGLIV